MSYNYIKAKETIQRASENDAERLKERILNETEEQIRHNRPHCTAVLMAVHQVKATGAYPYNSLIADRLLAILQIESTEQTKRNAEAVVFYDRDYRRAVELVKQYDEYTSKGYIHIEDIDESFHGKKALLTGATEADWMTITKNDEPITLVCKDRMLGYRKPRMRTRYCAVGVGSDYFVKVTN